MDHSEINSALQQAIRYAQTGRPERARSICLSILAGAPRNAGALGLLGNIHLNRNDAVSAAKSFHQALRTNPNDAHLHFLMGNALGMLSQHQEAIRHFQITVQLEPGHWQAYQKLGLSLHYMGRLDEAVENFHQSISLNPDHAPTYALLAGTLKFKGNIDEARENYEKALTLDPALYSAYHALANCKRFENNDDSIRSMESILNAQDLPGEQKLHIHYALARAYEDTGEYDNSFTPLQEANRLKRATFDYSIDRDVKIFNMLTRTFTPELMSRYTRRNHDCTPIFIVGMPRSGSTLAEQILSSHPNVRGAGEIPDFHLVLKHHGLNIFDENFEHRLANLNDEQIFTIGEQYLQRLKKHSDRTDHITDKFPQNFLVLGFIWLTLPGAKIIHCLRDPVDSCLSCFQQHFTRGHEYSYNLTELGQYYRLYQKIMEHWRAVIPGAFLDFHYETLIEDQEGQTRKLLDYCDLPWNDSCLDYRQNTRAVRTASDGQVRKPVYSTSVKRWKHFEKNLQPLLAALHYNS